MKNKLIGIGAYFFGAIAVVTCGYMIGSSLTLTLYLILLVSSIIALRLYWMSD